MKEGDIIRLENNWKILPRGAEGIVEEVNTKIGLALVDFSDYYISEGKSPLVDVIEVPLSYMEVVQYSRPKNKLRVNDLRELLARKINLPYSREVSDVLIDIHIFRPDLSNAYKAKYKCESYQARIIKKQFNNSTSRLDVTKRVNVVLDNLTELAEYLDKTGYLKREEWIKDE